MCDKELFKKDFERKKQACDRPVAELLLTL